LTSDDSSQVLVGGAAILVVVIVEVDLILDPKALRLTAAKRHVVLDPTLDLARGLLLRCEPRATSRSDVHTAATRNL